MNTKEIFAKAKQLCTKCKVCPVCNGIACKGQVPGPGGKGSGASFIRNVEKLKEIKLVMDVMKDIETINCDTTLFGHKVSMPVYAAPIAGINNNYGADMTDEDYTDYILKGCIDAGTIGFTGDGKFVEMFTGPLNQIQVHKGMGIPTMKPWVKEGVDLRLKELENKNIIALAMDVDSAGLPLLRNSEIPVENKGKEKLAYIKENCHVPFIIKGVMSKEAALVAKAIGADGIVVSNHGGRVLDHCLATCEVLKDIREAVGDEMTILVDGGVRTGVDVFKMLALGANGVLIGRPISHAAIGNQAEGVTTYLNQIKDELIDTMRMCGVASVDQITYNHIA